LAKDSTLEQTLILARTRLRKRSVAWGQLFHLH